ncbi:MAG TPA: carbohydrate ABC transporter permease [Gammaproteobacteria bacterium]|nr:carbohydrate ABC transporter permease [Gammaproteobacteria bacterium]
MDVSVERRQPVAASTAPGRPPRFYLGAATRYTLLTILALIAFAPFILSFLGTFKTNAELAAFPPSILPKDWRLDNWQRVWNFTLPTVQGRVLARWLFNSAWLALVNVLLRLFFCSLAAYAFARMRFPGRNLIFGIVIASMALPAEITLIPGYVFYARINWINTYWPLIIPDIAVPFGIFMLTQFFRSIPKELEEAAYMDGASRFRTYWSVALPLSRPALLTLAILQFQGAWNDYTKPLLFLQKPDLMTLTIGMAFFRFQYTNDLSAILVGAMFNAIPMLILFFIFSKYYMEGASYSGLAGQ